MEQTVAEKVLDMLMSSRFEQWYENDLMDYAEGSENAKSKEEILADITKMVG